MVLAGAGTLARATAKGIGRPCFRVVQTHFAVSGMSRTICSMAAACLGDPPYALPMRCPTP